MLMDVKKALTKIIKIYTDGSYNHKLEKGAHAFIIVKDDERIFSKSEFTPFSEYCLNHIRAEIEAVLSALTYLILNIEKYEFEKVIVYSDYEGIQKWMGNKMNIKNPEVKKFIKYMKYLAGVIKRYKKEIIFEKVKAHSGDKHNDFVDQLCKEKFYGKYYERY